MARVCLRTFALAKRKLTVMTNFRSPLRQKNTSALFIPGSRATETFAYFSPYLDFDEKFANIKQMQEELEKRGLNINLVGLKSAWDMYMVLMTKKTILERNQQSIGQEIKNLYKEKELSREQKNELERLNMQLSIIKRDHRTMMETIWEMEEDVVIKCLKLPNKLHEKTPVGKSIVTYCQGEASAYVAETSHIDIGTQFRLIDYRNSLHYFLLGKAVSFEQNVLHLAGQVLRDKKFVRVTGLDFTRASIVEGSGLDHHNPNSAFMLKNINDEKNALNPLHLVGNSSLISFLALNTKMKFNPNHLPALYFSAGRQYTPESKNDQLEGLFGVCQESVVHFYGLTKDHTECSRLIDEFVDIAKQFYGQLCQHYRIVMRPADELKSWESLRISFELWSCYKQEYIETGFVAFHGDYFGKRLLTVYQTPSGRDFVNMLSGTLISVPRLLGCLLEEDPRKSNFIETMNTVGK